jgi:hypothetical protein
MTRLSRLVSSPCGEYEGPASEVASQTLVRHPRDISQLWPYEDARRKGSSSGPRGRHPSLPDALRRGPQTVVTRRDGVFELGLGSSQEERPDRRLAGTFAPDRRASDKPIAIACFRLVTVLPLPPDFSRPRFISCIARSTFVEAFFEYLRPVAREVLFAIAAPALIHTGARCPRFPAFEGARRVPDKPPAYAVRVQSSVLGLSSYGGPFEGSPRQPERWRGKGTAGLLLLQL